LHSGTLSIEEYHSTDPKEDRHIKCVGRNELVTIALHRELAAQQRAAIDVAFASMADDPVYHAEARELATAFAAADWEALRVAEETR